MKTTSMTVTVMCVRGDEGAEIDVERRFTFLINDRSIRLDEVRDGSDATTEDWSEDEVGAAVDKVRDALSDARGRREAGADDVAAAKRKGER